MKLMSNMTCILSFDIVETCATFTLAGKIRYHITSCDFTYIAIL